MFAGEQLIIMEMKPHTLYAGQTPDLVHFYNQPTRKELNLIFLIFFKDKTCKIFPFLSHIDLVFWLVPVWIYCGVFATIEGSIAPHLSPLVPQSGYKGANIADWAENNKKKLDPLENWGIFPKNGSI